MRRLAYLFFTLLLICCSQDNIVQEDVIDNGGKNEGKGSYPIGLSRTISQGGTTREYILKVPESYTSDTTTPLLINFHGYGGSAFDYQQSVGGNYGLDALADNETFFVAYPQAAFRQKGANYWEPTNYDAYRQRIAQERKNKVSTIFNALKNTSDVQDDRAAFHGVQ